MSKNNYGKKINNTTNKFISENHFSGEGKLFYSKHDTVGANKTLKSFVSFQHQ